MLGPDLALHARRICMSVYLNFECDQHYCWLHLYNIFPSEFRSCLRPTPPIEFSRCRGPSAAAKPQQGRRGPPRAELPLLHALMPNAPQHCHVAVARKALRRLVLRQLELRKPAVRPRGRGRSCQRRPESFRSTAAGRTPEKLCSKRGLNEDRHEGDMHIVDSRICRTSR